VLHNLLLIKVLLHPLKGLGFIACSVVPLKRSKLCSTAGFDRNEIPLWISDPGPINGPCCKLGVLLIKVLLHPLKGLGFIACSVVPLNAQPEPEQLFSFGDVCLGIGQARESRDGRSRRKKEFG
jgi:hypothetical protein